MSDQQPEVRQRHGAAVPPAAANGSKSEIRGTNPMAHSGAPSASDADADERTGKSNPTAHSGAPSSSDARADEQTGKSNPTAHSGARGVLSHRQLAAARLLARGHGTMRVAERLGVNRHTVARWKRDPRFAAELGRLVASLTDSALRLRAGSRNHAYFTWLATLRGMAAGE